MANVRASTLADMPAITAIYAHHVLHSTVTFEMDVPSQQEMAARREDVLAKGLPYLVIEQGDRVLGYAYANWFKPRAAYRFSAENSIYLQHDAVGMGLGKQLLGELLQALQVAGIKRVLAVIGGSDNLASIALHRSQGFEMVGVVPDMGYKFERWLDVIFMQRELLPA